MPSTIDLRRRIRSVKNTQQITKAMKMVAAAKLRRAQERMMAARPYSAALRQVLASMSTRVDMNQHPLLQEREQENKVLLVVVTADRGLAGAFNTNILRAAQNAILEKAWPEVHLLPIGRKALDFFKRRRWPILRQATGVYQALSLDTARDIATGVTNDFVSGEFDAVYVIYNEFKSIIAQRVTLDRLLPLPREWATDQPQDAAIDYLYEPDPAAILSDLLPKHIEFQLYRVLLESAAAEQGARMTAMESATKNASEMISHLTLTYNRIRQASITKEIIEIVSGAAAAGH
ncbi:MAG TPA: ATP synthase F1 subunit gamma [Thermoanaerobaculia bacterium]|nr:ATP synthase F1 subunit gamma [Thermoanaerobaculia bacterium]